MKSTQDLDRKKIPYRLIKHDGLAHSAQQAASELNLMVGEIVKTMVFESKNSGVILFLIPGDKKFDRKKIVSALGDKTIDLAGSNFLLDKVGYPVGLVTPFGAKKDFPVYADESINKLKNVAISSGMLGSEIILEAKDLLNGTKAKTGDYCK